MVLPLQCLLFFVPTVYTGSVAAPTRVVFSPLLEPYGSLLSPESLLSSSHTSEAPSWPREKKSTELHDRRRRLRPSCPLEESLIRCARWTARSLALVLKYFVIRKCVDGKVLGGILWGVGVKEKRVMDVIVGLGAWPVNLLRKLRLLREHALS